LVVICECRGDVFYVVAFATHGSELEVLFGDLSIALATTRRHAGVISRQ